MVYGHWVGFSTHQISKKVNKAFWFKHMCGTVTPLTFKSAFLFFPEQGIANIFFIYILIMMSWFLRLNFFTCHDVSLLINFSYECLSNQMVCHTSHGCSVCSSTENPYSLPTGGGIWFEHPHPFRNPILPS